MQAGPLIALPDRPELTPEGYDLIVEFETGGKAQYERNPHPEWPGFASGVTVGLGYDCGYNSKSTILMDWQLLPEAPRLAATSGFTGQSARSKAREVRDILIRWPMAEQVFNDVTVTKFYQLCQRTFPGFDALRPNAQAALVSLVFNRGSSMAGPRRVEMRSIRDKGVPKQDYDHIAAQLRKMKNIWAGTDIYRGMVRRREAEARLVLSP